MNTQLNQKHQIDEYLIHGRQLKEVIMGIQYHMTVIIFRGLI